MKLRTSYFNKTIFLKNVTRFAPVWGLFAARRGITLLTLLMTLIPEADAALFGIISAFGTDTMMTFFYGAICALVLFGDLYKSGICNALHAMPLRRECWFVTNVVSGIAFHAVPTLAASLLGTVYLLFTPFGQYWHIPLQWFVSENLTFLCFFGIAVFSALCVGKRFAMAMVYGILNFGAYIVYWLVDNLVVSQFYGIQISDTVFQWFCPAVKLMQITLFETLERQMVSSLAEQLPTLLLYAAVGIALMGGALLLYRRRNLECAGDFMSTRIFEPVFLVTYTLTFGALFNSLEVLLFVGIAIGYFTGTMLLRRTARVFNKKTFLGAGVMAAVVAATLTLSALDPLGIESYIPAGEEIASVRLYDSNYSEYADNKVTLKAPEDIEAIRQVHAAALEEYEERWDTELDMELDSIYERVSIGFTLEYRLKNGKTVSRHYSIDKTYDAADILNRYFSSPACVFDVEDFDAGEFLTQVSLIEVTYENEVGASDDYFSSRGGLVQGLTKALIADCEAGTMSQNSFYQDWICKLEIDNERSIYVYTDCENTINWLRQHNPEFDTYMKGIAP